MTRTPFSIILDGAIRYVPAVILRSADYLPSKAMRKLKRNRELVNNLAKERVNSCVDGINKGMESGKDVLNQIGNLQANFGGLDADY